MKRLCYSKCDILKSCEKIIIVVLQPFGLFRFPWYLSHFDDNIWNLISIATCHHKCFIGSTHWVWMRVASISPLVMRSLPKTSLKIRNNSILYPNLQFWHFCSDGSNTMSNIDELEHTFSNIERTQKCLSTDDRTPTPKFWLETNGYWTLILKGLH